MSFEQVIFRVDSGSHIGVGHLMRCITLAEEFYKQGLSVSFLTKEHLGHSVNLIPEKFEICLISNPVQKDIDNSNYKDWLGTSEEEDAQACNKIISNVTKRTLFVIDHYSLNKKFEKELVVGNVFVIDDLMSREHYCDFLLDQNLSSDSEKYKELVDEKTTLFLGVEYALLRNEFKSLRDTYNLREKPSTLLVSFGGSDVNSDTLKFLKAFVKIQNDIKVTIVLPESHKTYTEIKEVEKKNKDSVNLLGFTDKFSGLMAESDLFIGAGGSTSWERCCLGLPSIIVSTADNQKPICQALSDNGLSIYLGDSSKVDEQSWVECLNKYLDYDFSEMSLKGRELIDGNGAKRIVENVLGRYE